MLQLLRIIRILNSDANPAAIASAVCLALFIGLTPFMSPHNLLILLVVLIFRVHLGTFLLAAIGFGLLGLLLAGWIEQTGYWLLKLDLLTSFWTTVYNTQFGRLSLFNFTALTGGLFLGLISFIPLWFLTIYLVNNYRSHMLTWVEQNYLIKFIRGSALVQKYQQLESD